MGVGGQFSLVETCGAFWGSRFLMFLEAIEDWVINIGWDLVSGDVVGCVWFCGRWCGQRTPWGVKMCNGDRHLGCVCVCAPQQHFSGQSWTHRICQTSRTAI